MFLKEFDYSIEMHKMKRKFNDKLINYGLIGEERVAYCLNKIDPYVVCLYNIRMTIGEKSMQIDFLVITCQAIYILEVKNLLGNILITKERNVIRKVKVNKVYNESSMENPFIQMEKHEELLKDFLEKNNIQKRVESILVMANDKMIIENKSNMKNIIRYDELESFIMKNKNRDYYTEEEIKIGKLLLNQDKKYNYFMLNIIKKNIRNQYTPKFENYLDLDLYIKVLEIRKRVGESLNIPLCNVFNNKEAELLVINKPTSKEEFISIKGFKEKRYEMYGEDIIKIFKNN